MITRRIRHNDYEYYNIIYLGMIFIVYQYLDLMTYWGAYVPEYKSFYIRRTIIVNSIVLYGIVFVLSTFKYLFS